MNIDERLIADIRHVTDILRAENDSVHVKRLDLLQADMEALMAADMDGVIERVIRARNNVISERAGPVDDESLDDPRHGQAAGINKLRRDVL